MKEVIRVTLFVVILVLAAFGCRRETTTVVADSETSATSSTSSTSITETVSTETAEVPQPPATSTSEPAASQLPNQHKVQPVDQASSDRSFEAFRKTLTDIVQRKDSAALLAIIDPEIRASFGDANGLEAFKKMWKLDQPDSRLWGELSEVLRLGGSWRTPSGAPRTFWAPWTFSNYPENGPDPFSTLIVTERNVPLKEAASVSSKTLGTLSFDIVNIAKGDSPDGEWRKVSTSAGTTGYLPASKARSHIDYRAGFEKKEGQWKMIIFIAGD